MSKKVLKQLIKEKYKKNKIVQNIIIAKLKKLQKLSQHIMIKEIKLAMRNLKIWDNQLWISSQLYASDHKLLQLKILKLHHLITIAEYLESKKMYQSLLQNYFWSKMKQNCKQYANNYSSCRQFKICNVKKQELLKSLSIS